MTRTERAVNAGPAARGLTVMVEEIRFQNRRSLQNMKYSIAVTTNSRSMIFVTIVSCVRCCVCVFDPIYYGASLRLSVYV